MPNLESILVTEQKINEMLLVKIRQTCAVPLYRTMAKYGLKGNTFKCCKLRADKILFYKFQKEYFFFLLNTN